MAADNALTSAESQKLHAAAKQGGTAMMMAGLCVVIMGSITGGIYIWYSTTVPATCTTPLGKYFLSYGITTLIGTGLLAMGTCAAKEMFSAASHGALLQKHTAENKTTEAAEDQEALENEQMCAGKIVMFIACMSCPLYLFQIVMSILGIVWAVGAEKCGSAPTTFWVLLIITVLQTCSSAFSKGTAASHAPVATEESEEE